MRVQKLFKFYLSKKVVLHTRDGEKPHLRGRKSAICRTIWNVNRGDRLRQAIAFELGYVSWKGLTKARVIL